MNATENTSRHFFTFLSDALKSLSEIGKTVRHYPRAFLIYPQFFLLDNLFRIRYTIIQSVIPLTQSLQNRIFTLGKLTRCP